MTKALEIHSSALPPTHMHILSTSQKSYSLLLLFIEDLCVRHWVSIS